jgi:hypothetical protein
MTSLRLLAVALAGLTASTALVAAADGKHEYSTGHVVGINYSEQTVSLDNGYTFRAERAADLDRLWIGESVFISFVRQGPTNVADTLRADNAWLADPQPSD